VSLPDLVAIAREAATEDVPAFLGKVAEAEAVLRLRLMAAAGQTAANQEADRLLTLPEVAAVLGVPKDRAYDLARRSQVPVVTVGKYKRVRLTALWAFIYANEKMGLDASVSVRLASRRDRGGRPKTEKAARSDAGRIREARRRPQDHCREVGRRNAGVEDNNREALADARGAAEG
jgi:hypothetical protein